MDETKSDTGNPKGGSDRTALCSQNVDEATTEVVDWMLQGASGAQIMEALAAKHPNADVATVMMGAGSHFERIATADTQLLRGWCYEATRDLYRRMIEIGDYANALRAVKQMRDFTK